MKENISAKTVCGYYSCASIYGLDSVMKKSDFHSFQSFWSKVIESKFCLLHCCLHCHTVCVCEPLSAGVSSGFWTTWWPTKMLTWWKNLGMFAQLTVLYCLYDLLAYSLSWGIVCGNEGINSVFISAKAVGQMSVLGNLRCVSKPSIKMLSANIPPLLYRAEVMEQLIQSSDLFVMQVEMDVYTALKKVRWKSYILYSSKTCFSDSLCNFLSLQWMFLQLNQLWDGPIKQLLADADAWLCKRRTGTARPHHGQHVSSYAALFFFVAVVCLISLKTGFVLQTCARKSPFWTQRRARLFAQRSNTFVSSMSSTIWHLHASWRETIFCPLVRCDIIK